MTTTGFTGEHHPRDYVRRAQCFGNLGIKGPGVVKSSASFSATTWKVTSTFREGAMGETLIAGATDLDVSKPCGVGCVFRKTRSRTTSAVSFSG
jgi:hypothetical protein